jgi:hypothetical protein
MRVACLLVFVIVSAKLVNGFTVNDPKDEIEFEPVDQYRRRMGIEYAYNTTILNPEICRYYNETGCEEMEKNFKEHAEARRKLQFSASPGVMKVIVLRIWFPDHADYFDSDPLGGGRYFSLMRTLIYFSMVLGKSRIQTSRQLDQSKLILRKTPTTSLVSRPILRHGHQSLVLLRLIVLVRLVRKGNGTIFKNAGLRVSMHWRFCTTTQTTSSVGTTTTRISTEELTV